MPPATIKVEQSFSEFVRTFRRGGILSNFLPDLPPGELNADYYFPDDNVIAELKTLETDAFDLETFGKRVMASYKWLGYELEDFLSWVMRKSNFPEDVSKRLWSTVERPIIQSVKRAHKQIRSSRYLLDREDAQGLILIANSRNLGFEPVQIMNAILKGFSRLSDSHRDALVYFTPNVYHIVDARVSCISLSIARSAPKMPPTVRSPKKSIP